MLAIIDYGVGNLFSLSSSLKYIGAKSKITSKEEDLRNADAIILPGVGAFGDAINKLHATGLVSVLKEEVGKGKPLLGICLGMQLLFEKSYEYGVHDGLGLINGNVISLEGKIDKSLKIPHMGWNKLNIKEKSPLLKNVCEGEYVYFVHSYFVQDCEKSIVASANHGISIPAVVQHKNIFGCQFHPEKSGDTGLNILKAFAFSEAI